MAEIEPSVLSRQCLSQRLRSLEEATRQVEAWQVHCNQDRAKVNWCFTTTTLVSNLGSFTHHKMFE
ncbi:hypothetical protein [Reticulibacter mediterranei]|uniref:hypothetical protein n=1 Tax=Reticulibacter mediterranei TaxID=2778369 RepID=UPI001C6883BB|nr:hypothetical protein [Reticulibacter mediterranei]